MPGSERTSRSRLGIAVASERLLPCNVQVTGLVIVCCDTRVCRHANRGDESDRDGSSLLTRSPGMWHVFRRRFECICGRSDIMPTKLYEFVDVHDA